VDEDVHGPYLTLIETLGRRTAELHRALTRTGGGAAFAPEPITPQDLAAWRDKVEDEARATLERLERDAPDLPEDQRAAAEALCSHRDVLLRRLSALLPERVDAVKTRYHGDFHLGQVLVAENDVILIDFEGEPARPMAERRMKHSPLRDVAGMLRSFDYAAHVALARVCTDRPEDRPRLEPEARQWERQTSEVFLSSYRAAAADSPSYPHEERQAEALIRLFGLEKVMYELRYELDNRPEWVGIPLRGLRVLLGIE
jgi:maltose alpha-D-glucosyltransferase/alpha-amylase